MEEHERETVVVENNQHPSHGWLVGLGVLLLLIILFFSLGGANLFSGASNGSETINVDTPDNVQVQPSN